MPTDELIGYLMFPAVALVVLTVLILQGRLSPRVFEHAPPRIVAVTLIDLFVGAWIMIAVSLLMLGPALAMLGIPLPGGTPPPTTRQTAITALVAQALTQLPVVAYVIWCAQRTPQGAVQLGLIPRRPGRDVLAGLLGFLSAMPLVLGSSALFLLLGRFLEIESPKVAHDLLRKLLTSPDAVAVALMFISAVIVAPILEEVIFRGLVQTALLSWLGTSRRWLVIFIAGALFALVHAEVATWHVLPGLFILGVVLGWQYERHGSLLPCVVLHVLFNGANIALGLLQSTPPAPAGGN